MASERIQRMQAAKSGAPVRDELLQRAADLVPVLQQRAAGAEQQRQLPQETIEDFIRYGLLRVATPERFGGTGHEFNVVFDINMELGRGCGSSAWCYAVWSAHNWMLGHWPEQAQEEYFAGGPNTLCSSGFAPTGKLEPVRGGYRLSGHWDFSSGCDAATWAMLGALAGAGGPAFALVPRADYEIIDTWFVAGMRGTGSKDIKVEDAFVPAHRIAPMSGMGNGESPGWKLHGRASYRLPLWSILSYTLASPLVGAAQGAIDAFIEHLKGRSGPGKTADSVALQLDLAESSAEVDAAHLLVQYRTADLIKRAERGEELSALDRMRYRRDVAYVAKLCVQAVSRLFEASGGGAIYDSHVLQRYFRDVHAGSHHIATSWDPAAEQFARLALGLEPLASFRI